MDRSLQIRRKALHSILVSLQKQLEYAQDEYESLVKLDAISHIPGTHADPQLIATNMKGMIKRTYVGEIRGFKAEKHMIVR